MDFDRVADADPRISVVLERALFERELIFGSNQREIAGWVFGLCPEDPPSTQAGSLCH